MANDMKWYYECLKLYRDGKQMSEWNIKALDRIPQYLNKFEYNDEYPNALINFIENFIFTQKGGDDGSNKSIKLMPEQKFWIELFGIVYPNTNREVITDIPLIVGAGSGKSTFMACLAIAVMVVGSYRGSDVLVLANTKEQAQETFRVASEMVSDERSILYQMKQKDMIRPVINKIFYPVTNSMIEVKAMDNKSADGSNVRMAIFDEFHAYLTNVIENIRKSSSVKRMKTGFTTVYISTNGQTRGAVFDDYYKRWEKVLDGDIEDWSTFPMIYKLDDIKEVRDVKYYEKAMPFINDISDPNIVKQNLEKVMGNPAGQAEILAKSFNIPQSEFNALFTTDELNDSYNMKVEKTREVVVGWDISEIEDLTCVCFGFRDDNGVYNMVQHSFIPEETFENRTNKEKRLLYAKFIKEGSLELVRGNTIDQDFIYRFIYNYIKANKLTPIRFAGDGYYSKIIQRHVKDDFGEDLIKVIPQSISNLSEPTKKLKAGIRGASIKINDDLTKWALTNVRVKYDANNNIFPNKAKAVDKIDPVLAMISCLIGWEDYDFKLDFAGW